MLSLRSVFVIIFLYGFLMNSSSYIMDSSASPKTHPDHPGKCWSLEKQRAYSVGESFEIDGVCAISVCNSDLSFNIMGCGLSFITDKACRKVAPDFTRPYPICCQVYECTDADGNTRRV